MESSSKNSKSRFLASTILPSIIQSNEDYQSSKQNGQLESAITFHKPLTEFTFFPNLPTEIRLKIWDLASDTSLIIDIWTEYRRCENNDSIFYHQHYGTKLTNTHSRVLHANRESREESLNYLLLKFGTKVVRHRIEVGHEANIRVNWYSDVFLPRGYWNMIAYEDFLARCVGPMRRLAVDPTTSFWADGLKKYVLKGIWPFVGLEEITLYDATGLGVLKPPFIDHPIKNPVKLEFVDSEPSTAVSNAHKALNNCFDKVQEKKIQGVTDFAAEKASIGDRFLVYVPDFIEKFERPKVRVMKLQVAGDPGI